MPDRRRTAPAVAHPRTAPGGLRDAAVVTAAFAVARAVAHAAGVRFDATPIAWFWQVLELDLLRDDLARSLWYLHAQPPLFNAFVGAVLDLAGSGATAAFAALYRAAGLAAALALLATLRALGAGRGVAVGAAVAFSVSPTALVYESWLFYSWPLAAVLAGAAFLLERGVRRAHLPSLAGFFALLAAAALTRSTFHLAWLVACVLGVAAVAGLPRRRVLAAAALPVALTAALYAKNAAVFGTFSASSWLGMSLARMTTDRLDPADRERLVREGALSEVAAIPPFTPLSYYPPSWVAPTGPDVPALRRRHRANGYPNFNYHPVVRLSRQYLRDDLAVVRLRPEVYLGSVGRAWLLFGLPPTDLEFVARNRAAIAGWDRLVNALGGQPASVAAFDLPADRLDPRYAATRVAWLWVAAIAAAAALGALAGARGIRARDPATRARAAVLLFAAGTSAWVAGLSNLVELGENNRFRVMISPLLVLLVATALADALRRRRSRVGGHGPR